MVIPLDHSKIPNMANIDEPFQDAQPSIRAASISMPYMWGTVGIGYRKSAVNGTPDSWKVLLDSDEYAGAISLLGDQANVLGAGLKYLGYLVELDQSGRAQEGRGTAHQAEEEHQGLRRRQRPGSCSPLAK